jgi:hypothetical protein
MTSTLCTLNYSFLQHIINQYDAQVHSLDTIMTFTVQPFQINPKNLPASQNGTDTSSTNLYRIDSGSWQSQQNNDPHTLQLIFNTASIK